MSKMPYISFSKIKRVKKIIEVKKVNINSNNDIKEFIWDFIETEFNIGKVFYTRQAYHKISGVMISYKVLHLASQTFFF
jgi:hypothetical protein